MPSSYPHEFIYKYHKFDIHLIELITMGEFYLSSYEELNDPIDSRLTCKYSVAKKIHGSNILSADENATLERFLEVYSITDFVDVDEVMDVIKNYITRSKLNMNVCSFSAKQKPDLKMWAQYADSNNGVCLEFRPSYDTNLMKVKYRNPISLKRLSDVLSIYKYKKREWKTEEEWRLINPNKKISFDKSTLTKIILGHKVPDSKGIMLYHLLKKYDYKTKIVKWMWEGNEFVIEEYFESIHNLNNNP